MPERSESDSRKLLRRLRDVLATPNALFFDGSVSRLYAPMLERHDAGFPMGPMIGVVTDLTTVKD